MTLVLLLQAFVAPMLAAVIAAFTKKFYPVVLVVSFWVISIWVKGTSIEAMDSVAMALTLSVGLFYLPKAWSTRWKVLAHVLLLAVLSVWQVKNFASSLSPLTWTLQAVFLAFTVGFSWWVPLDEEKGTRTPVLSSLVMRNLFLLVPIGYLAILSPLAGSILVGQIAGLVALFGLVIWLYQGLGIATGRQLAIFVAAPTLFIGQMAYHYVEIPWTSLAIGLVGWLPLLSQRVSAQSRWLQLLFVGCVYALLLAIGLYLEWPEQSLY